VAESGSVIAESSSYIGSELELFARAVNWKAYYGRRLAPFIGRRVAEIGAGIGGTTAILCRGSEEKWVCVEPDPGLAAEIGSRVEAGALPACCEARAGTSASLRSEERLDTALYIDVLEHIEDDRAELARIAHVVRPGGHVVVMSPAHPFLYSAFDAAIGHHRRYTKATLAAAAPFTLGLARLEYLDSVGMLASAANRLLLRQSLPTASQIAFWDRRLVPLSRALDPLVRRRVGKSVLAVWRVAG
jgi:SAM-dependent methyltransferase